MYYVEYDVVIVGSGPSGLFSALTLAKGNPSLKVAIIEKGKKPGERICTALEGECSSCAVCNMVSGGGGAGMFSDGKLVLDLNAGGHLDELENNQDIKSRLVEYIDKTMVGYDGKSEFYDIDKNSFDRYSSIAKELELQFKIYKVRHMGSHNLKKVSNNFIEDIKKRGIDFFFDTEILSVERSLGAYKLFASNYTLRTKKIIFAVGKVGSTWLKSILSDFGCEFSTNRCYFGIRLETRKEYVSKLFEISRDPKFAKVFKDESKIKTHCSCEKGQVILLKYNGFPVIGGHTVYTEKNKFKNCVENPYSNLNILMATSPNRPINPWDILGKFKDCGNGKAVVQKMGDFINNKTSESFGKIIPYNTHNIHLGNLRELTLAVDNFPSKLIEFLHDLAKISPGILDNDNLLYGPAIEWWMDVIKVDKKMKNSIPGIYAVGDGAGLSQGIVHSAATGIIAAEQILSEFRNEVCDLGVETYPTVLQQKCPCCS